MFGYCTSPLIYKDLLLVDAGGEAGTMAFFKMTGAVAWKCPTSPATFTSLMKTTIDNQDIILSMHEKGLSGITPDDGKEQWFTPVGNFMEKVTTPTMWGEKIFVTCILHGCRLIEIEENRVKILWKNRIAACLWYAPRSEAKMPIRISAMSFRTGRRPPACAIA